MEPNLISVDFLNLRPLWILLEGYPNLHTFPIALLQILKRGNPRIEADFNPEMLLVVGDFLMIEVNDEKALIRTLIQNANVIALFHSSWCPFCKNFLDTFNKQSEKNNDLLFIRVKIDEDENPLWEKYSLEAVPSIILFKNGNISRRLDCKLGFGLSERQFNDWLSLKKDSDTI